MLTLPVPIAPDLTRTKIELLPGGRQEKRFWGMFTDTISESKSALSTVTYREFPQREKAYLNDK